MELPTLQITRLAARQTIGTEKTQDLLLLCLLLICILIISKLGVDSHESLMSACHQIPWFLMLADTRTHVALGRCSVSALQV